MSALEGSQQLSESSHENNRSCSLNSCRSRTRSSGGGSSCEEEDEDVMLVDVEAPDGGWGWVVVFASFMVHVLADGVTYAFGALTTEFVSHFGASREAVGWMASLLAGMTLSAGPLASILCNKYGFRAVTLTGSVISSIGFCAPFFYPKFWFIYLSACIFTGIGFGLVYLPSIVTVSIYFHKKRAFAIGLAVCGSGIGTFLFSPLIEYFNAEYGWQGTMLLVGGLILNCFACGSVYRPLRDTNIVKVTSCSSLIDSQDDGLAMDKNTISKMPTINVSLEPDLPNRSFLPVPGSEYPMERNYLSVTNITSNNNNIDGGSHAANDSQRHAEPHRHSQDSGTTDVDSNAYIMSAPDIQNMCQRSSARNHHHHHHRRHNHHNQGQSHHNHNSTATNPNSHISRSVGRRQQASSLLRLSYPHLIISSQLNIDRQTSSLFYHPPPVPTDDIPLKTIASNNQDTEKALSNVDSSDNKSCAKSCGKENFDVDLLRHPIFMLFAFSNFFTSIGFNAPFLYAKDRALQMGIDNGRASFLISSIGIGNTLGRVLFGYLSTKNFINRLQLYNGSLMMSGFVMIFSCFAVTYSWMILYTMSFGALTGTYVTLTSVVLVDLLGIEKLNASFGMTMVFQGLAVFIGPPLAGWIFDVTNSFDWSFWVCGGFLALSGAMLYFVYCSKDFRKKDRYCKH